MERPQGGPLGLLEHLVSSLRSTSGREKLLALFGAPDNKEAEAHMWAYLNVVLQTVGGVDVDVAAYRVRSFGKDEVDRLFSSPLTLGLELLQTKDKWVVGHELLVARIKSFDQGKFLSLHSKYHDAFCHRKVMAQEKKNSKKKTLPPPGKNPEVNQGGSSDGKNDMEVEKTSS